MCTVNTLDKGTCQRKLASVNEALFDSHLKTALLVTENLQ